MGAQIAIGEKAAVNSWSSFLDVSRTISMASNHLTSQDAEKFIVNFVAAISELGLSLTTGDFARSADRMKQFSLKNPIEVRTAMRDQIKGLAGSIGSHGNAVPIAEFPKS